MQDRARITRPTFQDGMKAFLRGAASIFEIVPSAPRRLNTKRYLRDVLGYDMPRTPEEAMRREWETVGASLGDVMGLKRDKNGAWARVDGQPLTPKAASLKPRAEGPKS